jgi:hypothetical protein
VARRVTHSGCDRRRTGTATATGTLAEARAGRMGARGRRRRPRSSHRRSIRGSTSYSSFSVRT